VASIHLGLHGPDARLLKFFSMLIPKIAHDNPCIGAGRVNGRAADGAIKAESAVDCSR
jgi:hypothetical protein